MKIVSVNIGIPQTYTLDDVTMETSMVRHSVPEIQVTKTQVVGDRFKSPNLHGTSDSVVYALSVDRYPEWSQFLGKNFPIGHLGENLSVDVLRESDFYLGDIYEIGTTVLKATGPRYPCNRLNFVAGDKRMQKEFEERAWPGVYFEVIQEGVIKPGDDFKLKQRQQSEVTVLDLYLTIRSKKRGALDTVLSKKVLGCGQLIDRYIKNVTP
ncbi:MAG: MOSC domain-containing protein [Pseudobdellovibrio sp.]